MNDTRIPLLFAVISYWLIGFTCACWLGFRTPLGAVGVWIGLSVGTAVYAVLLLLRFRRLASRLALPMTVRESHSLPSIPARCWPARSSPTPSALKSTDRDLDARRAARADDGASAAMGRGAVVAAQFAGGAARAEDVGRRPGRAPAT